MKCKSAIKHVSSKRKLSKEETLIKQNFAAAVVIAWTLNGL